MVGQSDKIRVVSLQLFIEFFLLHFACQGFFVRNDVFIVNLEINDIVMDKH